MKRNKYATGSRNVILQNFFRQFLICWIFLLISWSALGCSIGAWDPLGAAGSFGVTNASAVDASSGVPRYSGRCALRTTGPSQWVSNNGPSNELAYKARFYFYVETLNNADIFRALNASNQDAFRISYSNGQISAFVAGAITQPAPIAVQIDWTNVGVFTLRVDNSQSTASSNSVGGIETIRLGATNPGASGTAYFDEFDSRSTTSPGLLCRGDANGSGLRNAGDSQAIVSEVVNQNYNFGQPDCDENGQVNAGDAQCVIALVAAGQGSCTGFTVARGGSIFRNGFE
jgi:hypothetical protein